MHVRYLIQHLEPCQQCYLLSLRSEFLQQSYMQYFLDCRNLSFYSFICASCQCCFTKQAIQKCSLMMQKHSANQLYRYQVTSALQGLIGLSEQKSSNIWLFYSILFFCSRLHTVSKVSLIILCKKMGKKTEILFKCKSYESIKCFFDMEMQHKIVGQPDL